MDTGHRSMGVPCNGMLWWAPCRGFQANRIKLGVKIRCSHLFRATQLRYLHLASSMLFYLNVSFDRRRLAVTVFAVDEA